MAVGLLSSVDSSIKPFLDIFNFILPNIILIAIAVLLLFFIYITLNKAISTAVTTGIKRKEDREIVIRIWHYGYIFIALLVLVISFSGSLAAAGISIGLFTAALGLALQKPIISILAWLVILIRKPFKVGDIIIINDVKGEVDSITMFHIFLNELSGPTIGMESSNRTILVPTSTFFENIIINATMRSAYVLDEIEAEYSSTSDLARIEKIMVGAAEKFTADVIKSRGEKPFTRVSFGKRGICVKVVYRVLANNRQKASSNITREIYNKVKAEKNVEFSFPHSMLPE